MEEEFDFNEEVKRHFQSLNAQATVAPPKPVEESNLSQIALIILAILVSGMTCFAIWQKTPKHNTTQIVASSAIDQSNVISTPLSSTSNTDQRIDDLTKRVDLLAQRQWVLGIAANENAVITSSALAKIDPVLASKIMLLDEQWKLNRAPEFLLMTDADRQKLIESGIR